MAGKAGGKRLVIVESPTKVKTIAGYLGDGYVVESSRGHVRDLPTGAAEVPAAANARDMIGEIENRSTHLLAVSVKCMWVLA